MWDEELKFLLDCLFANDYLGKETERMTYHDDMLTLHGVTLK